MKALRNPSYRINPMAMEHKTYFFGWVQGLMTMMSKALSVVVEICSPSAFRPGHSQGLCENMESLHCCSRKPGKFVHFRIERHIDLGLRPL